MKDIGDTLAVLVGENYINRFGMDGRSYDVIPQSLREQLISPEALARYYVKSASGRRCRCRTWCRCRWAWSPTS